MRRTITVLTLWAMLLTLCVPVEAQQTKKIPRLGYLVSRDGASESARSEGIQRALRERGYIQGQNIAIEYRYAKGKADRYPELLADLVRLKVDVILVAGGSASIRTAKNWTKTIPIVMTGGGLDPVEAGLVESLARPGGNVTGVTDISGHLNGKRLELLKEAVIKVAHIAVLYQAKNARNLVELKEIPAAARALGLIVHSLGVRDANDFDRVIAALEKERPDALHVLGGPLMNTNQKRTVDFALRSRLPTVYDRREAVDAGGLMYYGADLAETYRRVAYYVDRILKGAKPADLPVEQPRKFEFVINLKTAKQIGLTIPPNVLARADEIIR